jgi:hypothetical protein
VKSSGLLLSLVLLAPGLFAQIAPNKFISGCSAEERKAVLQPTDPAYSYAIDLARLLTSKGIRVECICASKSQHLFQGQKGAAYFRTDAGVFDSLYLPKGQVFQVETVEKPESGRYIYRFRGSRGGLSFDSAKRFVKHKNVLLLVGGDRPLAARLEQALNSL